MMTRVAPASRKRRTRSRSAGWPKAEMVIFAGSRPACFAIAPSLFRLVSTSAGVARFGSQPSPHSTTRSSTFLAWPPRITGGGGFFAGVGLELTGGEVGGFYLENARPLAPPFFFLPEPLLRR